MAYKHDDEHDRHAPPMGTFPAITGIELIHDERERQINEEGFNDVHDAQYKGNELLMGAHAYLTIDVLAELVGKDITEIGPPASWPWDIKWWKPKDRKRNLARAGALIAAELDRIIAEEAQG